MLRMSSLVNDSVPCCLLVAGEEFPVHTVEGAIPALTPGIPGGRAWVAAGCKLPGRRPTCAGGAHDILSSQLHFLLQFADCPVQRLRCFSY